jgi:hypothetical protein
VQTQRLDLPVRRPLVQFASPVDGGELRDGVAEPGGVVGAVDVFEGGKGEGGEGLKGNLREGTEGG